MDLNSMPVDTLECILLHLDSPICLVRASSTCKLWRRIISGTFFLQRFRSLHEPPVVGSYHNDTERFLTARPSFIAAPPPTTISHRYLSLENFISMERLEKWTVKDSRGSLLLLEMATVKGATRHESMFVVEPFTRRFKKVIVFKAPTSDRTEIQAFLLDGTKPGEIGMSNFRVVGLSKRGTSAGIIKPDGYYRKVRTGNDQGKKMLCMGSAAGSIYWYTDGRTVFALDKSTAEFSFSSLPDTEDFLQPTSYSKFDVTTGRDGKARIVFLAGDNLKIFARPKPGSDWVMEKSVPRPSAKSLGDPSAQYFSLVRSVPLSAETMGTVKIIASPGQIQKRSAFNLDIENKQLKRTNYEKAYPIKLPWPPSLHACTAGDT